jgi:lipopolysaccharide export system protein LptA
MSRTTTSNVVIDQQSGEVRATGGVISTYLASPQGDSVGLGAGAAHVSADALSGSITSGHATYAGHARLWQGDSVLDADRIELWRDDKRLLATGHVVAVFPQQGGPLDKSFSQLGGAGVGSRTTSAKPPAASASSDNEPALWKVVAPSLGYWSDQGKARLEGGVLASSGDASLESKTMDVYLGPAPPSAPGATPAKASGPPASGASPGAGLGARELTRLLAQGGAVVRQGDRRGTAEQAEYTAADGRFVLSGGQPTITDAASNSASGRSLTFFVANDTILLDSQEGSRTLTRHRVEK